MVSYYSIFKRTAICILCLLTFVSCKSEADSRAALDIAKLVADKVIRESAFKYNVVEQEIVLGLQIVDFGNIYQYNENDAAYTYTFLRSSVDSVFHFGLNGSGRIEVWLNDRYITRFQGESPTQPVEESYNRFDFQELIQLELKQGDNSLLIRSNAASGEWGIFVRPVDQNGELETKVEFTLAPLNIEPPSAQWLCIGPFKPTTDSTPIEQGFLSQYTLQDVTYNWIFPKQNVLLDLRIGPDNSYLRDSYLDWHYANGATMWSVLALGDHASDQKYATFVSSFCDFLLDTQYYFEWQYRQLHAFRGSYHRLYRRTMLDDTGAPALPFADMYLQTKRDEYKNLLMPIDEYVMKKQVRLEDGTFCRPEPFRWTIWADDLFMSVPFMLRMAQIKNDPAYYDDVAAQINHFYQYLFDSESNLSYHGWFSSENQTSIAFWGRANGWMIWALSEALLYMPETHPEYKSIQQRFKVHIDGLLQYQHKSGLWHQVLDKEDSFLETSCTAMYTLAIARGVRNGWLPGHYEVAALKAWRGLKSKIGSDGTVYDICRGTGIGFDLDFYYTRKRFDHDPRGLGAVITAAIEIDKLQNENK